MLSVTLATKNEEKDIRRCLESVKWADEIIVVDDASTDQTITIAKEYTSKIIVRDSHGNFHENKNYAIEVAQGEWILSLDADEEIPPTLSVEIKRAIQSQTLKGYYLNRKNYFLGQWIQGCGWFPDHIIRLFRKGETHWPLSVHETPQIQDKTCVGFLKEPFLHYSYKSLEQYLLKFNLYTSCLAKEYEQQGRKVTKGNVLMCFVLNPFCIFIKKYFFLKGFRDGLRGLFISFSSGWVLFMSHAKLWERQQHTEKGEE